MNRAIKGEDIDNNVDTESINDIDKLAVLILEIRLTSGTLSIAIINLPTKFISIKIAGDLTKKSEAKVIPPRILVIANVVTLPNLSERNFDGNETKVIAILSTLSIIPNSSRLPLITSVK
ncbi:hypothetical protein YN1HA_4820 [Sulfurisphaera ohwakuensis]